MLLVLHGRQRSIGSSRRRPGPACASSDRCRKLQLKRTPKKLRSVATRRAIGAQPVPRFPRRVGQDTMTSEDLDHDVAVSTYPRRTPRTRQPRRGCTPRAAARLAARGRRRSSAIPRGGRGLPLDLHARGTGFTSEVLAVCSAIAGEGKSTVAVGIAVAIAQDFPDGACCWSRQIYSAGSRRRL